MSEKKDAANALAEAERLIGMIGKEGTGSRSDIGRLHAIKAEVVVHYQKYDGAQNYHTSGAFDRAFSEVVRRHWSDLLGETLSMLRQRAAQECAGNLAFYQAKVREAEAAAAFLPSPPQKDTDDE